jgi:PIN domain nuclease of toxin-antitoxin system
VILLDTHVLIWYLAEHPSLPQSVKERIDETSQVFVSCASIWELGIKGGIKGKAVFLGKRPINSRESAEQLVSACAAQGIKVLDITPEACTIAPFFPSLHKDPFDRMIAAQSLVPEKLTLISADTAFDSFGSEVTRFWQSDAPAQAATTRKKKPNKSAL